MIFRSPGATLRNWEER
jgi:hypothetical protein